jgi:hypothetical protein
LLRIIIVKYKMNVSREYFLLFFLAGIITWLVLLTLRKQTTSVTTSDGSSVSLSSITSDIIPSVDNLYKLGTTTKRWKSLHVGEGTIYITDNISGTEAGITISDGVFKIDNVIQAQLEDVSLTNLTFGNESVAQTTAYIKPLSIAFSPQFNTVEDNPVVGAVSTGFYTMITPKICFFRVKVDFSSVTNFGLNPTPTPATSKQYKIDLPFESISSFRVPNGLLHKVSGNSLYHIAGTVDIGENPSPLTRKTMYLYYFAATTDLPWKSSTPVDATTTTSHFDFSGTYEIN